MLKIGITGQDGFIGTHLSNRLRTVSDIEIIPFKDNYFQSTTDIAAFVCQCDVIIHLAAVNRCNDTSELYDINIRLVKQLIDALEKEKVAPHVIFSSSIQEESENSYGKSKREGRELFYKWATRNQAKFTGLIIPNVYGPFGRPYYNSVIATFCHQLTHNEQPKIEIDSLLKLIYIDELINEIHTIIIEGKSQKEYHLLHSEMLTVSDILQILSKYKIQYFEQGIFPELYTKTQCNLFNTFLCSIDIDKYFPVSIKQHIDDRGSFMETIKLKTGGQVSFSTTKVGVTRGNHYHTRKIERFIVLNGEARIQLRKIGTDKVYEFYISDKTPSYIDIPIWYTHNITNVGKTELLTLFWINELFDANNSDTYFEPV